MATFIERLNKVKDEQDLNMKALTFLSDLPMEERNTLRQFWPTISVEQRRHLTATLASLAEENIELYFRAVFLIALDDPDPIVRASAIEGLFEDESTLLLERLVEMVRDDLDSDVREAAAVALGRFTYLAQCDKLSRGSDPSALRNTLLASANDSEEEDEVRRRAVEALGYLNGDAEVQALIMDWYRMGGKHSESALFAMGRNVDDRWQQIIMDELESDTPAMRYEAARAAGEMALEDALPLLSRLIDDRDLEVRLASVWALGQIGGKPAAQALARALQSPETAIREAAEEAISELAFSANPLNVLSTDALEHRNN